MIEKVKGLSICVVAFQRKQIWLFSLMITTVLLLFTVKMAAVKVQFQMAFLKLLPTRIQKNDIVKIS